MGPAAAQSDLLTVKGLIGTHLNQRASLATRSGKVQGRDRLRELFEVPDNYGDKQSSLVAHGRDLSNDYGGLDYARTAVSIMSSSLASPNRMHVEAQEFSRLGFCKVRDTRYSEQLFSVRHSADLVKVNGEWKLEAVQYLPESRAFIPITQLPTELPEKTPDYPLAERSAVPTAGMPGPATGHKAVKSELKSESGSTGTSGGALMAAAVSGGYNYQAMVNYALQWAWGWNYPAYFKYTSDCTNFVSQCMRAGGWEAVGGWLWQRSDDHCWFPNGSTPPSYSWSGAQNWRNFGYYAGRWTALSSPYSMGAGDVVGYDFGRDGVLDHVQLSQTNNGGNPLMAQHSSNTGGGYANRPLSEIIRNVSWAIYPHRT